jgi:Ca2+-binding RTX toxin-like protein
VDVNGVTEPVAVGFTRIVVNAGAGNDKVTFTGGPTVKRILYGGPGNDTLVSGNGPAVLVGGDGADVLTGGSQRDVLIGGAGIDVERGAGGDDILIDGATSFDSLTTTSEKALCGIQAEWTRTDVSFAGRVSHLLGHGHGSRSSTHFILSGPHRNVFSGGDSDQLDGGSGLNWFLCNVKGKGVLDKLVHRLARDVVTDL